MTLKARRLNRGLSIEDLAAQVEIPAASLYYLERTEAMPRDVERAKRLADFYGVLVTDLWPVDVGYTGPERRSAA